MYEVNREKKMPEKGEEKEAKSGETAICCLKRRGEPRRRAYIDWHIIAQHITETKKLMKRRR